VCASRIGPSETWDPGMPDPPPHTVALVSLYAVNMQNLLWFG